MRTIDTGHGPSYTARTSAEIAEVRAGRCRTYTDRVLFMDTYHRVRLIAEALAQQPEDLEMICIECTRHSPVMFAAMIEALAGLRAEGVRL